MNTVYKSLFRKALSPVVSVSPLTVILLAFMSYPSGYYTLEELLSALTNPVLLGGIVLMMLISGSGAYLVIKGTEKKETKDWETLKRMGNLLNGIFFVQFPLIILLVMLTVTRLAPSSFDRAGYYSTLMAVSYLLIACLPQGSSLIMAVEKVMIAELGRNAKTFLSLKVKLFSLVGGVFIGTVLTYISLQTIMSHALAIGNSHPLGSMTPFIGIGFIILVIIFFSLNILIKAVIAPVDRMHDNLQTAASGDFREQMEVHTVDEIGKLSMLSNKLIGNLNRNFGSINSSVSDINEAKESLSANVEEISGSIEQITRNLESANFQMEDHSANIAETTAAVEQMARNIESLGGHIVTQTRLVDSSEKAVKELLGANDELENLAATGKSKTDRLAQVSSEGNTKINSMVDRIEEILQSSQHLIEANSLIASVASQTNLLAMNAAIEAAHAGESGRGFAVVADEIRKLAETSSAQSKNINHNLKDVLSLIELVGSETQEMRSSFDDIIGQVGEVENAVGSINQFTSSIKSASEGIGNALNQMGTVSHSIDTGSHEMQLGNKEIIEAVSNMRNISQVVVDSVKEITLGSKEIMTLSSNMLEQNRITDGALSDFRDMMGQYKIRETS